MSASIHLAEPFFRPAAGAAPAGAEGGHFLSVLDTVSLPVRARRDEIIVDQDSPAGHCWLVVSGCVRTVRLLADGRRQVAEFLLPGDLFGVECEGRHGFGLEAVGEAVLRRYPRRLVEARAAADPVFAARLHGAIATQLRAGLERIVMLGRCTAGERIAAFLLDMTDRMAVPERTEFELPMNRGDMADYLGLTVETVSRRMAELNREGMIRVRRASVTIRNRRALAEPACTMH